MLSHVDDCHSSLVQFLTLVANDDSFKFEGDEFEEDIEENEELAVDESQDVEMTEAGDAPPDSPRKPPVSHMVPPSPSGKRKSIGGKRRSVGGAGAARRKSEGAGSAVGTPAASKRRRSSISSQNGGAKKRKRLDDDSDGDNSGADNSWK